jgi:hypothetical protein
MKLSKVIFSEAMDLPGARKERVIDMSDQVQRGLYDLELDARGFCRVRVLRAGAGQLAFIGPAFIKAAFAAETDAVAPKPSGLSTAR